MGPVLFWSNGMALWSAMKDERLAFSLSFRDWDAVLQLPPRFLKISLWSLCCAPANFCYCKEIRVCYSDDYIEIKLWFFSTSRVVMYFYRACNCTLRKWISLCISPQDYSCSTVIFSIKHCCIDKAYWHYIDVSRQLRHTCMNPNSGVVYAIPSALKTSSSDSDLRFWVKLMKRVWPNLTLRSLSSLWLRMLVFLLRRLLACMWAN